MSVHLMMCWCWRPPHRHSGAGRNPVWIWRAKHSTCDSERFTRHALLDSGLRRNDEHYPYAGGQVVLAEKAG